MSGSLDLATAASEASAVYVPGTVGAAVEPSSPRTGSAGSGPSATTSGPLDLDAAVEALGRARGLLASVLAHLPEQASPGDVDRLFEAFRPIEGVTSALRANLVRRAQLARAHEPGGLAGTTSYVRDQLGLPAREATKQAKLAHELASLPATAEAMASGVLGVDQAAAIARAAGRGVLGDAKATERQLLPLAKVNGADEFRRKVREEEQRADRAALERDEQRNHRRRRASLSRRGDGMWDLSALLTGEDGEVLATVLDAHRTRDPADVPLLEQRSPQQRTADALAALARTALAADGRTQGGSRVQLHVVVPVDVLDATGQGVGRTDRGGVYSPALIERLLCDANLRRVVTDGASEVLDIGRSRATWTVAQRRALQVRDAGCRGPGCDRPVSSCDAHHVVWWSRGGVTAVHNGLLLCAYHHRLVHEGGWDLTVDGVTGRAEFRSRTGRQVVTWPKGLPPTGPPGEPFRSQPPPAGAATRTSLGRSGVGPARPGSMRTASTPATATCPPLMLDQAAGDLGPQRAPP